MNESYHAVSTLDDLNHTLSSFVLPSSFVGIFKGDWDEAGYRTQRFVEGTQALPIPDEDYPFVQYDSWSWGLGIKYVKGGTRGEGRGEGRRRRGGDEAGYRTQRFVEGTQALPIPDDDYPFIQYDSWSWGLGIKYVEGETREERGVYVEGGGTRRRGGCEGRGRVPHSEVR
jgi:hypothetical protein